MRTLNRLFNRRPLALLVLAALVATACTPSPGPTETNSGSVSAPPIAIATTTPTQRAASPEPAATRPAPSPASPVAPDDGDTTGDSGPVAPIDPSAPGAGPDKAAPRKAVREPFAMNLFSKGDFVGQYTFEWCVGASLQMAVNVATDESRTSRTDQQRLWELARDTSFSPYGGANPRGWTATLNDLGVGPYRLASVPTLDEAMRVSARAIRETRRSVGLVMWAGRHAWVMTGFESTADPRVFDKIDVTGIRVLDPLYPHGSSVWGRSPKPNSLITPETLAKQFVFRDGKNSRVQLDVPPGYLLILPVAV